MILAILAGVYVLVCLFAFVFQKKLVFFPDRAIAADPERAGMPFEDVFFNAGDGVRLHGWFVPSAETDMVVLFFHGNAGNISHRLESIRIFHDLGLSVFIIDYRGYGRSGGSVDEAGTYADARAARSYLVEDRNVAPENIVYFGRSLGGAVAVELAAEHEPRGMILESCFPSLADVGARAYPLLPVRRLLTIRYDSTGRIPGIACPKLVIHSRDDEIVPFELGRRLYELAGEPKTLLDIRGDHNAGFIESGSMYVDGLSGFFESLDRIGLK
jgi:fermentation-respiration switch protein FrsA (DUF1100 family)